MSHQLGPIAGPDERSPRQEQRGAEVGPGESRVGDGDQDQGTCVEEEPATSVPAGDRLAEVPCRQEQGRVGEGWRNSAFRFWGVEGSQAPP